MACYHPNYMRRLPPAFPGDKPTYQFIEYFPGKDIPQGNIIKIPCGQCIGCRIAKSREWACRIMLESKYYESNYFLTLTYDDDHVPFACDDNGEVTGYTLQKEDLQKFFKRLRSNTGQKVRYYACGEYGDDTMRPHYHPIIFGLHLDDLVPLSQHSGLGDTYYTSETIRQLWPLGNHVVGALTWQSAAYVARYVTKKVTGIKKQDYEAIGIQPEFAVMSRKPGIGRQWAEDNHDKLQYNYLSVGDENGASQIPPPRYFKQLFPEFQLSDQDFRRRNILSQEEELSKASMLDVSWSEQQDIEEQAFIKRISSLERGLTNSLFVSRETKKEVNNESQEDES